MARLVVAGLMGVVIGVIGGAACGLHAQDSDTADAAADAGVDVDNLQAALDTLHDAGFVDVDARNYLVSEGLLAAPIPTVLSCGWPICGPLGQRLWCIEGIESRHGRDMRNPTPLRFPDGRLYHASGWLGFMQPTANNWGAVIGNRASEWFAAARMLAAGYGHLFFGVATGRC